MTLALLPNPMNKELPPEVFLPASVLKEINAIEGLIVEDEKQGRAFLKHTRTEGNWKELPMRVFNKHTPPEEIDELLAPLKKGERWGLISDGGQPCLADPGYQLVARCRDLGIKVKAFTGPSSIPLALMLSGLNVQRFAFHGYFPKDPEVIKTLEKRAREEKSTQVFIEAPYRNDKQFEALIQILSDQTSLCIAWDLTFPTQGVETRTVAEWKKRDRPNLHKKPAVFLFSNEF